MIMWIIFAILSAVFAALTSILAKVGIDGVNLNLATAIRTVIVVMMAWGMVFLTHAQSGLTEISRKSWMCPDCSRNTCNGFIVISYFIVDHCYVLFFV